MPSAVKVLFSDVTVPDANPLWTAAFAPEAFAYMLPPPFKAIVPASSVSVLTLGKF